jgi:hypothetical protein
VDWEKRLKESLKPQEAEWEKSLREFTGPQGKAEWESDIEELSKEVDEVERVSKELKEKYSVEQKGSSVPDEKVPGNPVIFEEEWEKMDSATIIASIDFATTVLKQRKLEPSLKKRAGLIAQNLIDVAMDPPEQGDVEERRVIRLPGRF